MRSDSPQRRQSIDLEFYRDIPIREVADLLGIEVDKNGKFLCPAHDDKNPSANIKEKTNRWKCFSCGEGGSTLDLVMHATGRRTVLEAARFLSEFYPGGIKEEEVEDQFVPPYISREVLREIGLKTNPFAPISVRSSLQPSDDTRVLDRISVQLSRMEAADLIVEKITDRQIQLGNYAKQVMKDFPGLDAAAQGCIKKTTDDKIMALAAIKNIFNEYSLSLSRSVNKTLEQEIDEESEITDRER